MNSAVINIQPVREFTCPKCGSHAFGSSCPGLMAVIRQTRMLGENAQQRAMAEHWDANAVGYCSECSFQWPRNADGHFFKERER